MAKHCEQIEITQERSAEVIKGVYNVIFNEMDIEEATKILAQQYDGPYGHGYGFKEVCGNARIPLRSRSTD